MASKNLIRELQSNRNPEKAKILQRFFKTGKGQYGEGDIFLGITVPKQREIAKKYQDLTLHEVAEILNIKIHEQRLTALIILVNKYKQSNEKQKKEIFNFYLSQTKNINNWDLVDVTCPQIVGDYLFHNQEQKQILYKLAQSKNLWEKRIAIISTFYFIRKENFDDTIAISEILLNDSHDLIHKAVGWMLREVGKKDKQTLIKFLKTHYQNMPRTMLRYSIEKFEEAERKKWLRGEL
jgi:3-methyladenine DNA glycosylase AlkD